MASKRVAEVRELGFDTVILPEVSRSSMGEQKGVKLVYVYWIQDAIRYIMNNPGKE